MTALHRETVRPERMLLVVVGNAPEQEFVAQMEKTWPSKSDQPLRDRRQAEANPGEGQGKNLELHKDVEQGFIVVGYLAPKPGTPENTALRVACGILGEGMSARMFARLRDRDHLAYAVGSLLASRELASHLTLYIGTKPDKVKKALEGMLREAQGIFDEPPTSEEIDRAKRYNPRKISHCPPNQPRTCPVDEQQRNLWIGMGMGRAFPGKNPRCYPGSSARSRTRLHHSANHRDLGAAAISSDDNLIKTQSHADRPLRAPSGGGKSTVTKALLNRVPQLEYSVSVTSRLPRGDEKEGANYHYVTEDEFRGLVDRGEFYEWAQVHGNFYGTRKSIVEASLPTRKRCHPGHRRPGAAASIKKLPPWGP